MEASVISDQKSSDAKQVNVAIEGDQKTTNDLKESKSDQKSSDAKQVNIAIEENQKTTNDFKESKSDQKSKQIAKKAKVETSVIYFNNFNNSCTHCTSIIFSLITW